MRRPRLRAGSPLAVICLACVVALNAGCVRRLVNKQFPPLNVEEKRLEAIQRSHATLGSLSRSTVYVGLSENDLQATIAPAVVSAVEGLSDVEVDLRAQELFVNAKFDRWFDQQIEGTHLVVRLVGSAELHATGFIENRILKWTPWASRVSLSKIQIRGHKPAPKIVVRLIVALLNTFLANINGAIGTQTVSLDASVFHRLDPQDLIKGQGIHSVEGTPVEVSIAFEGGAVLIDDEVLRAIGKLSEQTSSVVPTASAPQGTTAAVTERQTQQAFERYRSAFLGTVRQSFGNDAESVLPLTAALMSKPYVAGLFNHVFVSSDPQNQPKAKASFMLPPITSQFGGAEIRADPSAPNLNCQVKAEAVDCNPTDDCNLNKDCEPGWPCPSCEWYDAGCHIRRGACELDKGRFKAQCEAEKVSFRAECEARKVLKRAECEAKKSAELLACNGNQSWLTMWQGAHFANVRGNATFNDIQGKIALGTAVLTEDFSSVAAIIRIDASANVVTTFDIRPVDAGHLFCPLPFGGQVRFAVEIVPQTFELSAPIDAAPTADGHGLKLTMTYPEAEITFKTTVPPVVALLSQNPHFVISCAPTASVVGSLGLSNPVLIAKLAETLIQDKFPRKVGGNTVETIVNSFKVTVGSKELALTPLWLVKSFGFTHRN